jgi:hypothetical protein
MLGFSINFLDQLGALSGEIQTAVQNLAQTHAGDPGLVGFAESVAGFARLTHSALDELNSHVGNHGSQINGILLRRGGTVHLFYCWKNCTQENGNNRNTI